MGSQRAHIVLPQELIEEIDAAVGPRGRSAFLVATAQAELKKRRLLAFLRDPEPVMKDEDYPELAAMGTQEWVRRLREESGTRLREIDERDKQPGDDFAGHDSTD